MGGYDANVRRRQPIPELPEELIPELPEELVLAHVIPRLPWYTRPLCRALSRTWRAMLDSWNPELDLRTRMIQLPLLRGLFLFCTFDNHIFIRDHDAHESHRTNAYQIQPHWRKLPPLQGLDMTRQTMVASSGMVYVWSAKTRAGRKGTKFVLKLDMGCADWTWKKLPVPYAFGSDAITFNDKIYVPRIFARSQKEVVLALDMTTDDCAEVETWYQHALRAVSKKSSHSNALVEEMYGVEEEDFAGKLGVVMYDVGSDSWRTREEVPIPELFRFTQVELLNNDCFEPAPETAGINIVWIDHRYHLISWFNSSVGIDSLDICFNGLLEGKCLEYLQVIRGSIYGIFCKDKEEEEEDDAAEEEEDGEGLSILSKRVIMKGRIVVASGSVAWEEVHEVGFWQKAYHVDCSERRPIVSCTTMA